MRYNRGDINDTLRVASISSVKNNRVKYVFATGCGFLIDNNPPVFTQAFYIVNRTHIEYRQT